MSANGRFGRGSRVRAHASLPTRNAWQVVRGQNRCSLPRNVVRHDGKDAHGSHKHSVGLWRAGAHLVARYACS